jgi:MFS family permease
MGRLLLGAAGLRAFTVGLTGVLLGLYLAALGAPPSQLGLVVGLGLAGNAAGTAFVAWLGEGLGRRSTLLVASALSAGGLAALALIRDPAWFGLAAFLGLVNGMGRDRGPAQTVEQSLLADASIAADHAAIFTRYTFIQDVLGGLGSLVVAWPALVPGIPTVTAYRWTLAGGALLSVVPILLYWHLPALTLAPATDLATGTPNPTMRRRVAGLSALFALDSLGGGFLAGSVLSYWFFQRFGLTGAVLGPVFFAARGLNALSYFASEALSQRIGFIRTMVFTHLPSSLLLLVLPWTPSPAVAIAAFLIREALVQMDVPARQAYVATVTAPGERTFALGVTGLTRNVGWAVGPGLAGAAMSAWGLGAPLVIGAGLKTVYDVALFGAYRRTG